LIAAFFVRARKLIALPGVYEIIQHQTVKMKILVFAGAGNVYLVHTCKRVLFK
jgi:hypothetical protein